MQRHECIERRDVEDSSIFCSMWRPNIWQARSTPIRFISGISSQSLSDESIVGARFMRLAQFTRMSTFPNESSAAESSRSKEALSLTSTVMDKLRQPAASISAAIAFTCSSLRPVAMTSAPACANPKRSLGRCQMCLQ
jgi:hypothetical protein